MPDWAIWRVVMPEPERSKFACGSEIEPVAVPLPEIVPSAPRPETKPLARPTGSLFNASFRSSVCPTWPDAVSEPPSPFAPTFT